MTTLNMIADKWFDWQIAMLWQTAVLIAIIWTVDLAVRKWAHPQVRYALWMLVLVKLLIPPTFTSPASVTSQIPAAAFRAVTVMSEQGSSGILPESKMPSEQSGRNVRASDEAKAIDKTKARSASAGDGIPAGQDIIAADETPGTGALNVPKGLDTLAGGATPGRRGDDKTSSVPNGDEQPSRG